MLMSAGGKVNLAWHSIMRITKDEGYKLQHVPPIVMCD